MCGGSSKLTLYRYEIGPFQPKQAYAANRLDQVREDSIIRGAEKRARFEELRFPSRLPTTARREIEEDKELCAICLGDMRKSGSDGCEGGPAKKVSWVYSIDLKGVQMRSTLTSISHSYPAAIPSEWTASRKQSK